MSHRGRGRRPINRQRRAAQASNARGGRANPHQRLLEGAQPQETHSEARARRRAEKAERRRACAEGRAAHEARNQEGEDPNQQLPAGEPTEAPYPPGGEISRVN